ncbi:MAG: VacJ family lipoprotein [Rickettsia endosymbiont of Ixodes persulcatus]|nr:VacJ family lipoprotein [Rickettsia endosymbiont of Ixodes persulcatus]MCZ6903168.1 VacJ family lipoprotein [Rickettsia endosymbiont of Ixodes persulcatus]MCZ6909730.1 VacJ family lipoprotein [Rickettsia endosymbiont of Ixodes persulcatus]MCZ6925480.1 VacJ family lipoprotein [Rickettsia endosymbiont of Ixodes persulcatus]
MRILIILSMILCSLFARADLEYVDNDIYNYNGGRNENGCLEVYDPYEKFNRKVFAFNSALDYIILGPLAVVYKNITNDYVKARVNSFVGNVDTLLTAVNYGLQLNYDKTMKSVWRFLINTTLGIGGLFDVAGKVGLPSDRQTFGNTLAHYGVAPGPYLVLPIIGSTNARDMTDPIFTNYALNPLMYCTHNDFDLGVFVVSKINDRYVVLPFSDYVMKNSTDPYVAIRSALHYAREASVQYPENFKCPKPKN